MTASLRLAKEILLSGVIVLYLFQAIVSLCPPSELQQRLVEPGKFFVEFWGLNQSWTLFAPTIRDVNFHAMAFITFDDDTVMVWNLPRMDRLSLVNRFRLEKFRKWDVDTLPWPKHKEYWPAFARWTGRLFSTPEHRPVQMSLHLFVADIPKPVGELADRYQLPDHTRANLVFTYFYKPEDFE